MKSFFIETYGCQMNKADSASMSNTLKLAGYIEVENNQDADIVIINTCSVRKTAENRIWGRLGLYKSYKYKKNIILIVTGCMAQRVGEDFFLQNDTVDIVIGTFYRNKLIEIIKNYNHGERIAFTGEQDYLFNYSTPDKNNPLKAFVTISHGCNNYCSYCIVPYLRGREKSRPSNEIIDNIIKLTKLGVKQVTLLGQNVNSYGSDNNDISFPELLKLISRETDINWIKYLTSHPKDFTEELIDVIINEQRISKWLHLPVQSGSNKILQKMNRKYTIESYLDKIELIKAHIPKINLTTDIIIGFPGETDNDYLDTVNLIKKVEFNDAYMYKYNIRENTLADKQFKDDISDDVKTERLSQIIDMQLNISINKKFSRIGDVFETIPDNWSKKSKTEILGLTKDEIMIIFKGNVADFNNIHNIKAIKVEGNTLYGEKI